MAEVACGATTSMDAPASSRLLILLSPTVPAPTTRQRLPSSFRKIGNILSLLSCANLGGPEGRPYTISSAKRKSPLPDALAMGFSEPVLLNSQVSNFPAPVWAHVQQQKQHWQRIWRERLIQFLDVRYWIVSMSM